MLLGAACSFTQMHLFLLSCLLKPVELGLIFKGLQSDVVSTRRALYAGSIVCLLQEYVPQCLSTDVHVPECFCSREGVFAFSFDALDSSLHLAKVASHFGSSSFGFSHMNQDPGLWRSVTGCPAVSSAWQCLALHSANPKLCTIRSKSRAHCCRYGLQWWRTCCPTVI